MGRMIDKTVYPRSCKILSRELRNAAEWRRGIRCRGGIVGISLGCSLENTRDACQGCWENGRVTEPTTPGPRAWLRGMKQPLPASSTITKICPSLFPTGMLPLSVPTISLKPGDRDIASGNLIAVDKFNNRGRFNRDPDSIDRRAILQFLQWSGIF